MKAISEAMQTKCKQILKNPFEIFRQTVFDKLSKTPHHLRNYLAKFPSDKLDKSKVPSETYATVWLMHLVCSIHNTNLGDA